MNPSALIRRLLLVFVLVMNASTMAQQPANNANYRLGPSDTIQIQVFQEEDLSLTAEIGNNGSIDYPLIGYIQLEGLTLAEAESKLDSKLRGDYLINPQISISIVEYRPFFITGEVKSPGSYEYQPGMTIRQAIVIAGGLTDRASQRKVYLIREGDPAFKENKVKLNEKINAGDTITIKEGFF